MRRQREPLAGLTPEDDRVSGAAIVPLGACTATSSATLALSAPTRVPRAKRPPASRPPAVTMRPRRGRAPRRPCNVRPRGSKRSRATVRAGPDDDLADKAGPSPTRGRR
jgi:hypothetical protein